MELEDIILLLINKLGKDRHEIMTLMEKKQLESGGTISNTAAIMLVARDLNINLNEIIPSQPNKIKDLLHMAPGSSNITISAFIKRVYNFHSFIHDNEERFVQNFLISDKSSTIRVTLWGPLVKLASNLNLKKGDEIRIIKAVLKNGRFGERELHLGNNSSIERIENNSHDSGGFVWQDVLFPSSITNDHLSLKEIDIQGIIIKIFSEEEERRPSNIYIIDPETTNTENTIKVNFWKERKIDLQELEVGQKILLEGVGIKEGFYNTPEINVNRTSNVQILSKANENFKKEMKNVKIPIRSAVGEKSAEVRDLGSMKLGDTSNIVSKVFYIGDVVKFKRKDGSEGKVLRIGIFDSFGSNFLVLWDDNTNIGSELQIYDILKIDNCYLKQNKGNLELSLGNNGSITKLSKLDNKIISEKLPNMPIANITDNWKAVSLYGEIKFINEERNFKRSNETEGKVKSLNIADNSGEIKIVAWNESIELFKDLSLGDIIYIENISIRNNNFGEYEAHINKNSQISNKLDLNEIPDRVRNIKYKLPIYRPLESNKFKRIRLEEITEDFKNEISENYEINLNYDKIDNEIEFRSTIVDVFDNPLYYNACIKCSKKVEVVSDLLGICPNHNETEYMPKLLFRISLDDGTNVFFATFIGSVAERLTGLTPTNTKRILSSNNDDIALFNEIKSRIIGNEYIIKGRLEIRKAPNSEDVEKIYWDFKIIYVALANPIIELKLLENQL